MVKALATEAGDCEVRFPEAHTIASVLPEKDYQAQLWTLICMCIDMRPHTQWKRGRQAADQKHSAKSRGIVVQVCDSSPRKVEAGGLQIQGHPGLHAGRKKNFF